MPKTFYTEVPRIVAIGDLHGNYQGFRKILMNTGLINSHGHWMARNTHLIQLGDILGRGGEPGKIFKLLRRLEEEAPAYQSHVHVLLGNHEAMTMSGLLMYNTMAEFHDLSQEDLVESLVASVVDPLEVRGNLEGTSSPDWSPMPMEEKLEAAEVAKSNRKKALVLETANKLEAGKYGRRLEAMGCQEFRASLSPWGKVGKWLCSHDSAVIINDTLFVHGGLNREHGCQPLEHLNNNVRDTLGKHLPPDAKLDIMLRRDGPQWNREFTLKPNEAKGRELNEVLDYHDCKRMVVGHTPTSCITPSKVGSILPLYNEKLICIDTGIGKTYGEHLSALSLERHDLTAHYM